MSNKTSDLSSLHSFYWLPNALTVSRIISIPLIIWGILSIVNGWGGILSKAWVLGGLFVLACLTDYLDGYFARKWNLVSDFGRMIDPIADKLLVAGCLIAFAIISNGQWLFLVPALLIIGRDILVSGAREHAALEGKVMPPTNLAKWKTACEMLALAALIFWVIGKAYLPIDTAVQTIAATSKTVGLILLWLAALLSVYTGSLYFRAALKL